MNEPAKRIKPADDWAWHFEEVRAEVVRYQTALHNIATGEGYYGAQAREYKNIAREALRMQKV